MADNSVPFSLTESNSGDIAELANNFVKKWMQTKFSNRLPCIVTKVNSDFTRVSVIPLVKQLDTTMRSFSRGEKSGLPVQSFGTNSACIRFKITPGDLGWIEACDRDISLVKQAIESEQQELEQPPVTTRMFQWGDAIFRPDMMRPVLFNGNAYFGDKEKTNYIELFDEAIDVKTLLLKVDGKTQLGINDPKGIARLGDEIEVNVNADGPQLVTNVTGGPSPVVVTYAPVTLTGTIVSASTNNEAD